MLLREGLDRGWLITLGYGIRRGVQMVDRSLLAEVQALRAIMTAWVAGALAQNPDRDQQLEIIEDFSQFILGKDRYVDATEDEKTFIKEVASLRISQFAANVRDEWEKDQRGDRPRSSPR
jgi:hypothetical protein